MKKNKIKILLSRHENLMRFAQYFYIALRKPERLMKHRTYGSKNCDKTIFIIRPNSEDQIQGLMSLFVQTMRWMDFADKKKYVPYIDFRHYKTQYYTENENVWEYFFTQPTNLSCDEIYQSKNVIISGTTLRKNVNNSLFRGEVFHDNKLCEACHRIIFDHIDYSDNVKKIISDEGKRLNIEECLGLYLRGTDYIKLKPTGEYVQPELEDVISKVDEFLEADSNLKIFLVTEDNDYYTRLQMKYQDRLRIVSFDSFVTNYDGRDFLSKSGCLTTDKKKRGMDYLVKIALLAKCRYLISSITMGSIAAYCLNGGKYEKEYIFDLGYYK